jgi:hypothetical protein
MSKSNRISQAEARRMRRELDALKQRDRDRNKAWVIDYPGGAHLVTISYASEADQVPTTIRTARKLGHAVVAVDDGARIRFYGMKP